VEPRDVGRVHHRGEDGDGDLNRQIDGFLFEAEEIAI
jgi:hypothetical protein